MDKKTRVLNALDGKEVDCVPVGFWHHFSGPDETGDGNVRAHINYYKEANLDFIKIMSDGIWPDYACKIEKASDWSRIRANGKNCRFVRDAVERCKKMNDELNGECCTFFNVFAPFTFIRFYAGWDRAMEHLIENPTAVVSAMKAIEEDCIAMVEGVLSEGGCTGIYASVQGGEVDRFTVDEYEELIKPTEMPAILTANELSNYNILHLCGFAGIRNQLDIWKKYPARILNWSIYSENMTMKQGRKYFSPKVDCVIGGFNNTVNGILYKGTKEEIQDETRKIIEDAGRLGTIVGADCTIPPDTDLEHLRWVVETAHSM